MRKIKGFTLIELIIVMAILTILMASLVQMFRPIRETYVDSTLYEARRTSQNGMVQYITESVRFSTDLGIYTSNKSSSVVKAVEDFAAVYLPANGVQTTDSNYSTNLNEIKKYAEVIIIDNTNEAYKFNDKKFTGRLLRRKFKYDASGIPQPLTVNAEAAGTDECRIALGSAYYGESNYTIKLGRIKPTDDSTALESGDASEGIKVTVSSIPANRAKNRGFVDNDASKRTTTVTGMVICRNQCSPVNGIFDITKYDSVVATNPGTKVYIVYLNDKINILP